MQPTIALGRRNRRDYFAGIQQSGLDGSDRKTLEKNFDLLANHLGADVSIRETLPGVSATTQVSAVSP